MSKSIISELFLNCSYYGESIKLAKNEEYRKNYDKLYEICEKLCKDLPEDEKRKILDMIFDAHGGTEMIATDEFFKFGFKLGLTIGAQNFLD